MKKDSIIAALLTAALFSTIGYFVMQEDHAPPLPPVVQAPEHPAPATVPAPLQQQQQHTNGLYKCVTAGRTIYQDCPCEEGQQAVVGGTMSVVPRHPIPPRQQHAAAPAPSHQRAAKIEPQPPKEPPSCVWLRKRIRQIDAQARQKSTQSLTDERREVGNRMSELKCSHMD